ncbi:tripartite tricarboxylate transporter substrate binding protein [Roseomonas terrae]|uniref:Tripartite tricarboxylate transporter substrate binding protein n=1 Tax=Neoroseomonas terrae TaxID=424799 RepID=A0ABS5ELV6_9PROT|nr:tripartite tricarboxylate transporter substrate binding protein [Neoroseomonas terrae]MBR0652016.1 tripartite tricarboxylate transporter substrate binding protein [Neoroseomonas terrae]
MRFTRRVLACFAVALLSCFAPAARAEWPDRPIRLIVPFVPGGSSDILARLIAAGLQQRLGQPVVVDNRGGANGLLGMAAAAQAPADGYTLVIGHIGTHAISPLIVRTAGFETSRDFTTIAMVARASSVLVVPVDGPARDVPSLIQQARSAPSRLSYGSPGVGSPSHVAVVMMGQIAGFQAEHVPYRGNAAALTDMINGTLHFMFAGPAEVAELLQSGRLRALATSGEQRSAAYPQLPTVAEAGVPGFSLAVWHVLSVRSGTPAPIVARLRTETAAVLISDAVRERLTALGLEPGGTNATEADAFIAADIAKWSRLVQEANIRAD